MPASLAPAPSRLRRAPLSHSAPCQPPGKTNRGYAKNRREQRGNIRFTPECLDNRQSELTCTLSVCASLRSLHTMHPVDRVDPDIDRLALFIEAHSLLHAEVNMAALAARIARVAQQPQNGSPRYLRTGLDVRLIFEVTVPSQIGTVRVRDHDDIAIARGLELGDHHGLAVLIDDVAVHIPLRFENGLAALLSIRADFQHCGGNALGPGADDDAVRRHTDRCIDTPRQIDTLMAMPHQFTRRFDHLEPVFQSPGPIETPVGIRQAGFGYT